MSKQLSPTRIANSNVAAVFAAAPAKVRQRLLALRRLIVETANATAGVGVLEEALRWGEPAYLTTESGTGSTIRLGAKRGSDSKYALYFNCRTDLVDSFRRLYPTLFHYRGDREIEFDVAEKLPAAELSICIAMALTYHKKKP